MSSLEQIPDGLRPLKYLEKILIMKKMNILIIGSSGLIEYISKKIEKRKII